MTRRVAWAALTAAGVLVVVAAPIGWSLTGSPETVGADVAEALADGSYAPAVPAPTEASRTPAGTPTGRSATPPAPAVPTRDGQVGPVRAGVQPVRLELPSLGVRSPIRPVGVLGDGELEIPADVDTVGWYRFGARPGGTTGSTVLSGHVDSAEQGRGAFFRLGRLRPGDPVLVRGSDGRTSRYRVVAREEWPKTAIPLDRIFARDGAARLTLVTCGGGFREDTASYVDNIAVTAVPEAVR